ncbi:MAG: response regulator, partial [Elusimicrobiota bacterium]
MPSETILVVEDEKNLLKVLRYNLEEAGYRVLAAADGDSALAQFRKDPPALVLLDIMLPKQDGFEVCKALRSRSKVPILMLTARKEEIDRVLGFELGADDYVTKPFSVRELLARVKAILRRSSAGASEPSAFRAGGLEADLERYE